MRLPFLTLSVLAHAALLASLSGLSGHQSAQRVKSNVASSLRATTLASSARRLDDLQTIKRLLEESADRLDVEAEAEADPESSAPPRSLEEILARARDLSLAIETIDREIKADELAKLLDVPRPSSMELPRAEVPQAPDAESMSDAAVADEIALLATRARATLDERRLRLEAAAEGVQVEGAVAGSGGQGSNGNASLLAEIGAFIGVERSVPTIGPSIYAEEDFFGEGSLGIPPVDALSLVRGRGRMFGAGGEFANRVYLNSWYIIGPFAGRHGDVFENPVYPPENAVLLDAVYFGKDQRLLRWRYVTAQSYPLVPPGLTEDSVYYGYTEVFVDEARDLTAWIGADDDVQLYLNEQLVWKGGNQQKMPFFQTVYLTSNSLLADYNRTEGKRVLRFVAGRNKLFFKYANGKSGGFLSIVLTP